MNPFSPANHKIGIVYRDFCSNFVSIQADPPLSLIGTLLAFTRIIYTQNYAKGIFLTWARDLSSK